LLFLGLVVAGRVDGVVPSISPVVISMAVTSASLASMMMKTFGIAAGAKVAIQAIKKARRSPPTHPLGGPLAEVGVAHHAG
jgi:hypothetical protein